MLNLNLHFFYFSPGPCALVLSTEYLSVNDLLLFLYFFSVTYLKTVQPISMKLADLTLYKTFKKITYVFFGGEGKGVVTSDIYQMLCFRLFTTFLKKYYIELFSDYRRLISGLFFAHLKAQVSSGRLRMIIKTLIFFNILF